MANQSPPTCEMTTEIPPTVDVKITEETIDLRKSATEDESCAHIESLITAFILAINTRHFDPESPPWTAIAPGFSLPAAIGFRQKAQTRAEYVNGFKKLAEAYPKFRIEPLRMESYALKEADYAEVYLTAQSYGGPTLPTGMKRKAVGRHEFRRVKGVWLYTCETTFLGIGDGGAGFEM